MSDQNPYDALIQQDTAQRVRVNMLDATTKAPDVEARLQTLAKQYQMPVDAVRLRLPEVEQRARFDAVDYDTLAQRYPKTANHLSDPQAAALAQDDTDNLSTLERVGGGIKATAQYLFSAPQAKNTLMGDIGAGVYGASRGAAGVFQAGAEAAAVPFDFLEPFTRIGGNPLRRLAEGFGALGAQADANAKALSPAQSGIVAGGVSSGVQSLTQNLLALPMAFLPGGQGATLGMMASQQGGQSYQNAREKGIGQWQALGYGASDAVVEFATEKLPLGKLLGDVKEGTPLLKSLLRNAALEIPGEQVATVLQDLNGWATLHPEKPFSDYLAERPSAAAQTLIATLIGSGGAVTLSHAVQKAADNAMGTQRSAQQAEAHAQVLGQLATLAEASKVRERDPAQFRAFMQSVVDEGVPNVYVDANALMQAHDINEIALAIPAVAEQIAEAHATGGDLVIPTAELLTAGPGHTFMQTLLDNARTAPEAMSPVEARTYMQAHGDQMRADIEQVLAEKDGDQTWQAQRDAVRDQFKSQLDQVKRFTPDVNAQYAGLLANFYSVQAARLGIAPQELVDRYGLQVRADGVAGGRALDQPVKPRTEEFRQWHENSKVKKVVYHATRADFDTFDTDRSDLGAHFGTEEQANKIAGGMRLGNAEGTQVMPVWLNIRSPLRLKDTGTFHADGIADQLERKGILKKGEGKRIIKEINADWKLRKKYDPMLRDLIQEAGYDGIVYANGHEGAGDSYIAFKPEQIKSAIGNSGKFDPKDGNILNQFAGPNAKTADTHALATAQARIAQGDDAETVRRETGWHKGVDGKWRFEISDHDAKLRPALQSLKRGGHEAKPVKSITYRESSPGRWDVTLNPVEPKEVGDFVELLDVDAEVLRAVLPENAVRAIERGAGFEDYMGNLDPAKGLGFSFQFDGMNALPLSKVLDHPRLFAAYPRLADTLVQVDPKLGIGGSFVSFENGEHAIRIGQGQQLTTLLHEIQHGIQAIEGFATGGSPTGNPAIYEAQANAELRALLDTDPKLADAFDKWAKDQVDMEVGNAFDAQQAERNESALQAMPNGNKAIDLWGTLDGLSDPNSAARVMQDRYLRLVGEVEARNTQARAHLNEWDRQHSAIDATADVPADRAIVMFDGKEMANAPANGAAPRGSINLPDDLTSAPSILSLFKGADLSTFIHESGHFFLEVQMGLAARIQAQIDQGASVTDGEREIVADANKLLAWFGVKGSETTSPLTEWHALDLEGKRPMHEQFARGFEAYAFEGNAPSVELSSMFQKFRAWMIAVYKELKALNVTLTDDVRGVMDRMLASTQAIQEAEAARRMGPLFKTAEAAGMSLDEFKAYHALATGATQTAIEELQSRGLRDMRWLSGAKDRKLKELQKEQASLRRETQIQVRREVLSTPVYRAWAFFTGRDQNAPVPQHDEISPQEDYKQFLAEYGLTEADVQAQMAAAKEADASPGSSLVERKRSRLSGDGMFATQSVQQGAVLAPVSVGDVKLPAGRYTNHSNKPNAIFRRTSSGDLEMVASEQIENGAEVLIDYRQAAGLHGLRPIRRAPQAKPLDASVDSLHTAVAKLGGINKADAVSQWGVDPKDKPHSGVFGKPVWRLEGGLSLDSMAELLGEAGYLPLDDHGKVNLVDFEERFAAELRGSPVYSVAKDYSGMREARAGEDLDLGALTTARLDRGELAAMGLPGDAIEALNDRKMTSREGIHPDLVCDAFGFSSGEEMVRALAGAEPPDSVIEGLTDQRMLEQFGDLGTAEGLHRAADRAIHNEARARFVATEVRALETGMRARGRTGRTDTAGRPITVDLLVQAAKDQAQRTVGALRVRDLRPSQFTNAEARAARAAEKAVAAGDLAVALAEKRHQVINIQAARATLAAQDEVEKAVKYLAKFDTPGVRNKLPADYLAQIDMLREKFDLTKLANAEIDRTVALRTWVQSRLAVGEIPAISEALLSAHERSAYAAAINARDDEGNLVYPDDDERIKLLADAVERSAKRSYRDMTVDELRGLRDTVKQVEHLAKLKSTLLTALDGRNFEAAKEALAAAVVNNAKSDGKNVRTDNTLVGGWLEGIKQFGASHIKVATWLRIFDGGDDNGAWWSTVLRPANARASFETTRRAEATSSLMATLGPVLAKVSMLDQVGKGKPIPELGTSLNWQERFAIACNFGNESNLQRLMGGGIAGVSKALSMGQVQAVLRTLTSAEWMAVQGVWDHFESYRPEIAAKELRVSGVEPEWIQARPFEVRTADGQTLSLRGGYYPVVFDPRGSLKAQQHSEAQAAKDAMKAAYSAATTQRSFTKARVEEVTGRPLLLNMQGLYSGINDVIHDLAWHEWVIDVNRLMRSKTIDEAIREHYGPDVKKELARWRDDIVAGSRRLDHGIENAAGWARKFTSSAALTYNVMSAILQPLGITQSFSRVGTAWVGKGIAQYVAGPIEATRMVRDKSEFMANRTRTMFRDINELRNRIEGQTTARELMGRYGYFATMHMQMVVDVPTWIGGYEKAVAAGNDEATAIAIADQGVKDSQGGGEEVDQAGITRGGPLVKLFTAFYDFMNTQANVLFLANATSQNKADAFAHFALIGIATPILAAALKDALTPGDSGDWDDWEEVVRRMVREGLVNLIGMVAFGREFSGLVDKLLGTSKGMSYSGPTGLRVIPDALKLGEQASQGEFDNAFRKAFLNVSGDLTGIPSVQLNRTINGAEALAEGQTENPAALVFGYQKP